MIKTRYHDDLERLERSAEERIDQMVSTSFENTSKLLGIELTHDEELAKANIAIVQEQIDVEAIRAEVEADFAPKREELLRLMKKELSEISPSK